MSKPRFFGVSGSLRRGSFSTAILRTVAAALADRVEISPVDLSGLPFFNEDIDGETPPLEVTAMRADLAASDGMVIVTPEYNHSVPGVLKNALDWLSRPAYSSPLAGKPALIVSSSPGLLAGARAQMHLREVLYACGVRTVMVRDIAIGGVAAKVADGKLTDAASLDHVVKGVEALIQAAAK